MSRKVHAYVSQEKLIGELSFNISKKLREAIKKRGHASLMVSGGSTPKALFKALSEHELMWENVTIGLCDERWVNPSSSDSNEYLVRQYLIQNKAATAHFIGMYREGDIEVAQGICHEQLQQLGTPFDVVILGMGSDGHTASLFPNNEKLQEAYNFKSNALCVALTPSEAPYKRMSLTLPAIMSASSVFLHFEGDEKIAIYNQAICNHDYYKMPISAVLNQEDKEIEVYFR